VPSIDYGNGGNLTEWIPTLDKVLQLDFDTAIPHGLALSKDDVRAFRAVGDLPAAGRRRRQVGREQCAVARVKTDDLTWPFPGRPSRRCSTIVRGGSRRLASA
jgi:hypothetical protein